MCVTRSVRNTPRVKRSTQMNGSTTACYGRWRFVAPKTLLHRSVCRWCRPQWRWWQLGHATVNEDRKNGLRREMINDRCARGARVTSTATIIDVQKDGPIRDDTRWYETGIDEINRSPSGRPKWHYTESLLYRDRIVEDLNLSWQ